MDLTLAPDDTSTEVVVLDTEVRNADILLDGLVRPMRVVRLGSRASGLAQIAAALRGDRGVQALHIVSPGRSGALLLAGEWVDLAALAECRAALSQIAAALSDGGRLILYGCSVAAGPDGLAFLDGLERALGVPVAASAGPVGSAARGGAWVLRTGTGDTAATAFSAMARAGYPDLLAGRPAGATP